LPVSVQDGENAVLSQFDLSGGAVAYDHVWSLEKIVLLPNGLQRNSAAFLWKSLQLRKFRRQTALEKVSHRTPQPSF